MINWGVFRNLRVADRIHCLGPLIFQRFRGEGIKVDPDNPSFTWRDLEGPIIASETGANRPTLTAYIGSVKEYAFAAGDEYSPIKHHIPHDWAGEDMFIHTHWSHNGTNISGQLVIEYHVMYAKGHSRGAFTAHKTLTHTISGLSIANTATGDHRIDEIPLTTNGGSSTTFDTNDIEPDGLFIIHFVTTTIPTITGGAGKPFIHYVDGHYLSTNIGTKQRTPDFYRR